MKLIAGKRKAHRKLGLAIVAGAAFSSAAALWAAPPQASSPAASPSPAEVPSPAPSVSATTPVDEPTVSWTVADARALLGTIQGIDADGLIPADYQPDKLRAAIVSGAGAELDAQASKSFAWLIEDMRDGRTRYDSREQWFVVDTDVDASPTTAVIGRALASHDVPGAVAALAPTAPDYAALKGVLTVTPKAEKAKRNLIQINLDRWRWLPQNLGK